MPSWLPSIPYGAPKPADYGYWAPITSTLDWCEENYYATPYSAEVVNTTTNLLFMFLAFKGMYNCYKNGHDKIFFVTFLGYLIVGTGSFAFHATLKYPWQLVDELSMIYTTCLMFWATFEHKRSLPVKVFLGFFVTGLAVFITLYYHYVQDPTFHQVAYGILTAVVLIRSFYIMETNMRPRFRKNWEGLSLDKSEAERRDKRDVAILKQMWSMIALGLFSFLGGFAIWQLDNIFCSSVRTWRRELGLPWGIILEGHGWWHLGTGFGAYLYIVWGIWLRHCLNGKTDEYEVIWPGIFTSIPQVVRRTTIQNGYAGHLNGHGTKTINGYANKPMNGHSKMNGKLN